MTGRTENEGKLGENIVCIYNELEFVKSHNFTRLDGTRHNKDKDRYLNGHFK